MSEPFTTWLRTHGKQQFDGIGYTFEGDPPQATLEEFVRMEPERVSPFGKAILEGNVPADVQKEIDALATAVRAYDAFQDILYVTGQDDIPVVNRGYCYYESLVYLRESLVCFVNGSTSAAMTLLRPFYELALLHLYWNIRGESEGYGKYYRWLSDEAGKPSVADIRRHVVRHVPARAAVSEKRMEQLEKTLEKIYGRLCSYNHTPRLSESITRVNAGVGGVTPGGLSMYLESARNIVTQIVHLYVLNYPHCMFPLDRYAIWGADSPRGAYFDETSHAFLRQHYGKERTANLQRRLAALPGFEEVLRHLRELPRLSEAELEESWSRYAMEVEAEVGPTRADRIAFDRSRRRAIGWAANYVLMNAAADVNADAADL
jgi:hypothetical protein